MKHPEADLESWKWFAKIHPHCFCWWCGRGWSESPQGWFGPWLIERAHIVSEPRIEDRRVAILLCSWCHRIQHGQQLILPSIEKEMIGPSLREMLWLKKYFDADYYDRAFLQRFSLRKLPHARRPENGWAAARYRQLK